MSKTKVTPSCGNVFEDLGLPSPELHLEISNLRRENSALRDKVAQLEEQLTEIRSLVFPNDPEESHPYLMEELQAWDQHSDAGLRSYGEIRELKSQLGQAREALTEWFELAKHKGLSTERHRARTAELLAAIAPEAPKETYQQRVAEWSVACFGEARARNRRVRACRFLEEALELAQAGELSKEDCILLVDYVFGRDVGKLSQEIGGVMVTLAALCYGFRVDLTECAEAELARVHTKIEQIRAKQALKDLVIPTSPLPMPAEAPKAEEPKPCCRDWPEDATHENGRYQNRCCHCGLMFIGHKRRPACKLCCKPTEATNAK